MPRYVILEHDHPFPHFDFMLEEAGRLRTWRLREFPTIEAPNSAEPLGDHRIEYLEYEGPLTAARGRVKRVDAGTFEWMTDDASSIVVELQGSRIRGRVELTHS